jgi:hypothetical protein
MRYETMFRMRQTISQRLASKRPEVLLRSGRKWLLVKRSVQNATKVTQAEASQMNEI